MQLKHSRLSALSVFQVVLILLNFNTDAHAATLYLCKAYTEGRSFWSQLPCSQQQATMNQSFEVPAGMSIEKQVQLAQQTQKERSSLIQTKPSVAIGIDDRPLPGNERECERHFIRIKELDQISRQIKPSMSLDGIAAEREVRLSQMAGLKCRQRVP